MIDPHNITSHSMGRDRAFHRSPDTVATVTVSASRLMMEACRDKVKYDEGYSEAYDGCYRTIKTALAEKWFAHAENVATTTEARNG